MPRFVFKLPDIGEGIAEAEIVAWHVALGERVEEDQNLADMMTDKATVEMESPVAGTIVELAGQVGDLVAIGAALVVIETDAAVDDDADSDASCEFTTRLMASAEGEVEILAVGGTPGSDDGSRTCADDGRGAPGGAPAASAHAANEEVEGLDRSLASVPASGTASGATRMLASPAVRLRAANLGIDLMQVRTADGDRVRHQDLDAFLRYGAGQGYHPPHASHARADEQVRVMGMRRRIAENMTASKRHIPHFTYVDECDVTALEAARAHLNSNRGGRPKLTLLPLLIVAICRTLPDFPMLNARYDDEAGVVTRSGRVHLGMATQTDAGLTVPVISDAQDRNVWQLATEIARLAEAARGNRLRQDEMGGGTITLTSLGALGGIVTTPVINRPEVAIIGPNRIMERPVLVEDATGRDSLRRAKLMNVSISCDHRVVDGWDAASYVHALKGLLERPAVLLAG